LRASAANQLIYRSNQKLEGLLLKTFQFICMQSAHNNR